MNHQPIDIGNFRNDPERLYALCIRLSGIRDTTTWDYSSQLYHQFNDLVNDLWSQLPDSFTIALLDPEEP